MSADVIKLPERNARRKPEIAHTAPQFYCLKCDGTSFALFSDGTVFCIGCASPMKNLKVQS